jgi:hypothetical protein
MGGMGSMCIKCQSMPPQHYYALAQHVGGICQSLVEVEIYAATSHNPSRAKL